MKKIYFRTTLRCKKPYSSETQEYDDDGVLLLPTAYSDSGTSTRLIINCHGAGGTVTTDDSQIEEQTTTKYFLANGYAVMDVNGLPKAFADEFAIDIRNNIGSPLATESYFYAYQYCIKNYNLYKEVFVHGGSMGGISSTNLVLEGKIPVLAQTGYCPVLDTYNEIFLHPWSNGLPKIALAKMYSFDLDENQNYIYDENKLYGFNPMKSNKKHPCPLFFCHSVNDPVVQSEITLAYIERAKMQGVEAELLLLPDGGHEPQNYGGYVKSPSGVTFFNGEELNITQAVEKVFVWIKKHDIITNI